MSEPNDEIGPEGWAAIDRYLAVEVAPYCARFDAEDPDAEPLFGDPAPEGPR